VQAFVGTIILFAGKFAPEGWAYCDGRALEIQSNTVLFAVIGTAFGGDGTRTFALPNLPGVGGAKYIICLEGIFPSRAD
jgi:microcystin-dependent protein